MQTQELAGTAAADAAAEHEVLRGTVERFVRNELMPLEGTLARLLFSEEGVRTGL